MLSDLDGAVEQIVAALDSSGIRERTLVVFLSDNGGPTKELTSSNSPLRAGKGSMYEGGLRVPFIVNWPGVIPAGMVSNKLVSSLDIFATAVPISGLELPQQAEGQNLIELLANGSESDTPRQLFWRQGNRTALRVGEWKLVDDRQRSDGGRRDWELYNISSDMSEANDLAANEPERLADLVKRWEELNAEMAEPIFPRN